MATMLVVGPFCALLLAGPLHVGSGEAGVVAVAAALMALAFGAVRVDERERNTDLSVLDMTAAVKPATVKATRILIVGAGDVGRSLARSLELRRNCIVVGFADDELDGSLQDGWPVLGGRNSVAELVERHRIDEVVIAYAPTWQQRMMEELTAKRPEVAVRAVPSTYEAMLRTGRVESLGDLALVRLTEPERNSWDGPKRSVDAVLAAIALVVLSPLFLLAAILVKLSSPGPVLFRQERVGRYGRRFTVLKFRTMVQDAEAETGPVLSDGKDDPRLTQVGRLFRSFRIDEIPQLWNVMCGHMSLVGPRPERPVFVQQFEEFTPLYTLRHEVRPGITGLAQVMGGYKTDARDKLRFDLIYVSHRSLLLDVQIVLRTVWVVLSSHGS